MWKTAIWEERNLEYVRKRRNNINIMDDAPTSSTESDPRESFVNISFEETQPNHY